MFRVRPHDRHASSVTHFTAEMLEIALILCFAGVCVSAAQDATPAGLTFRVTSRLVVLDVSVVDKTGNPISGLQNGDFSVLEDGQNRHLDHVEEVATTASEKQQTNWIFVLDALNTPFEEAAFAHKSLRDYFEKQAPTLRHPITLIAIDDRGSHTLADTTCSRTALIAALNGYKPVLPSALLRGDGEHLVVSSVYMLRQLAFANNGTRGRKAIIWIGKGFPSIVTNNLPKQSAVNLQALMENLTSSFLDARVTLFHVDTALAGTAIPSPSSTNLEDAFDTSPEPFADSFSFGTLMEQTGGHIFYNSNDIDKEVAHIVTLGSSYYTLSYIPSPVLGETNIYRHIRVVVNRPGLIVSTRRGFYTHPQAVGALSSEEAKKRLDAAIINQLTYKGLALRLPAAAKGTLGDQLAIHTSLPISIGDSSLPLTLTFHIAIAGYDPKGKPLSYTQTIEAKTTDKTSSSELVLTAPAPSQAKLARLRIIVLETSTGEMGSIDLSGTALDKLRH